MPLSSAGRQRASPSRITQIDALFDIEREINGVTAGPRLAARRERSAPLVNELEAWMRKHRTKLSQHAPVAQAMDYMLRRWDGFDRFLGYGRIWFTKNAAEPSPRGQALGRKAWLADVLARIADTSQGRLGELLRSNWRPRSTPSSKQHDRSSQQRATYPKTIRVDQEAEFVRRDLDLCAYAKGVTLGFSWPGKPMEKAFIEAFICRFRSKRRNKHWFLTLADAAEKMGA